MLDLVAGQGGGLRELLRGFGMAPRLGEQVGPDGRQEVVALEGGRIGDGFDGFQAGRRSESLERATARSSSTIGEPVSASSASYRATMRIQSVSSGARAIA
jgi:hypothetical protein